MATNKQIQELIDYYRDMHIVNETEMCTEISGFIHIHRSIDQYVSNSTYELSIFIPVVEGKLPYVIDRSGNIEKDYPHRYSDGMLCLATDIDMVLEFEKNSSLVNWMQRFVEPYYITYEYYKRYGEYPNGDRAHGEDGIVQSYMEIFSVDGSHAVSLLHEIVHKTYRGHQLCPCGSGKRLRNCHGEIVLWFKRHPMLLLQATKDYQKLWQRYIYEHSKQQRNTRKTEYRR